MGLWNDNPGVSKGIRQVWEQGERLSLAPSSPFQSWRPWGDERPTDQGFRNVDSASNSLEDSRGNYWNLWASVISPVKLDDHGTDLARQLKGLKESACESSWHRAWCTVGARLAPFLPRSWQALSLRLGALYPCFPSLPAGLLLPLASGFPQLPPYLPVV